MGSIDTVSNAVKLTDRLKEFANATNVPRCLTVSDTELESLESSAILQLLWQVSTSKHLEFAVSAKNGSNQNTQVWTISIHSRTEVPTPGVTSNLRISGVTSGRVQSSTMNISSKPRTEGHGTG